MGPNADVFLTAALAWRNKRTQLLRLRIAEGMVVRLCSCQAASDSHCVVDDVMLLIYKRALQRSCEGGHQDERHEASSAGLSR